jgi:hypothetical protein
MARLIQNKANNRRGVQCVKNIIVKLDESKDCKEIAEEKGIPGTNDCIHHPSCYIG